MTAVLGDISSDMIAHGLQQKARKQAGCFVVLASSMADIEETTPGNDKTRRLTLVYEKDVQAALKAVTFGRSAAQ